MDCGLESSSQWPGALETLLAEREPSRQGEGFAEFGPPGAPKREAPAIDPPGLRTDGLVPGTEGLNTFVIMRDDWFAVDAKRNSPSSIGADW